MKKVITYGTYDLLHYGHIRLLERAKALGDYLVVGVTSDGFDAMRGKINVEQPLMERVEAVRKTGLADEIIIEEYEGQKINDIQRLGIDIFTVGSDWEGYFDYLKDYCEVVYLDRTQGISSSELRSSKSALNLGLVGGVELGILKKYFEESLAVNGIEVSGIYGADQSAYHEDKMSTLPYFNAYEELLEASDAVYIISHPSHHYRDVKQALEAGKHVLVESPITLKLEQTKELFNLAKEKKLVLMEAIKTAYSTAYSRLLLLAKSGKIGDIKSIDVTCTSWKDYRDVSDFSEKWNSMTAWGPTALLPIFQMIGTEYCDKTMVTQFLNEAQRFDAFTQLNFIYPNAVAQMKVGKGIKSEGDLRITGTQGYIYVPAPWWKTDYFELRFENQNQNKRYFYQLEGEGIRYELVAFVNEITYHQGNTFIDPQVSYQIAQIVEDFHKGKDLKIIK
ncbi:Gfo/Idh/MocA family oxidoreductase [Allofustis seminis]|uniref:Gfo/Idh/MocA family oxidoreductase n=1 Tax=Allofustis seminis TaxID=166939 RepID=UPI00037D5624|nr:Gfo/Idh/MocA family oxidoreductase [Allofustis seminis]